MAFAGHVIHFKPNGFFDRIELNKNSHFAVVQLNGSKKQILINDVNALMSAIKMYSHDVSIKVLNSKDVKDCVDNRIADYKDIKSKFNLYRHIYKESRMGKLDFSHRCGLPGNVPNDTGYNQYEFFIIQDVVYDSFDGGNLLWGYAMKQLKIPYSMVKLGAEANAVFFSKYQNNIPHEWYEFMEIKGDAPRDQKAIWRGYFKLF